MSGYEIGGEPPPQLQPLFTGERSRATVRLLTPLEPVVDDQLVKTSGIGIGGGGEGSCSGDSGGELFLPDQQTIVAVTSGHIAPLCRGTRLLPTDGPIRVLNWVRSFS